MVLSKNEELEILEKKQEFKREDHKFYLEGLKLEHECKMNRLMQLHLIVKDGYKGGVQ